MIIKYLAFHIIQHKKLIEIGTTILIFQPHFCTEVNLWMVAFLFHKSLISQHRMLNKYRMIKKYCN